MTDTTPHVLNAGQVASLIDRVDLAAELRRMFAELGREQAVQPAQTLTLFPKDKGDFITYMGAQGEAGVFGAKLSPYLVTGGAPVITGWTLLMSMQTGQPLLLCDSGQLTTERTAGTTALAVDLLARPDARRLAIIGAGAVAQAHFRHVRGLREWEAVSVYSPTLADQPGQQAAWRALEGDIRFSSGPVTDADVVMLCTSSGTPVIDAATLAPGTLVTSISTNVARAHEVDPGWLTGAQVYCDYRATTPSSAGEMVLAAEHHGWHPERILGDLPELVLGKATEPTADKPVFFRSIGLGLEDIAAANALLRVIEGDTPS